MNVFIVDLRSPSNLPLPLYYKIISFMSVTPENLTLGVFAPLLLHHHFLRILHLPNPYHPFSYRALTIPLFSIPAFLPLGLPTIYSYPISDFKIRSFVVCVAQLGFLFFLVLFSFFSLSYIIPVSVIREALFKKSFSLLW